MNNLPDMLYLRDGSLEMAYFVGDDWEVRWLPIKANVPNEQAAEQWIREMRQEAASRFIHEHPDGGWFVGSWDSQAGQWMRPLDAETKRTSGCYAEFSKRPFSPIHSRDDAIEHALELYEFWIDRELYTFWDVPRVEGTYDVPTSSITWGCRKKQITGARKTKSGWEFPLIAFIDWMINRPGSGRR